MLSFPFYCYVSENINFVLDCYISDKPTLCFVFDCYDTDNHTLYLYYIAMLVKSAHYICTALLR